jgi:predicted kinase
MAPNLIIISGPMGVGKTTVSQMLHDKLPRTALISYDQVKWFLSDFRSNESDFELTYRIEKAMTREYLSSSISVIFEKAFTDSLLINEIKMLADELSVRTLIYQLEAPLEVSQSRVANRPPSKKRSAPPTPERVERSHFRYHKTKHPAAKIFDSHKLSVEEIVTLILIDVKNEIN